MDPNNASGSLKAAERTFQSCEDGTHVSIPTILYYPASVVSGGGLTLKVCCCSSGGGGLTVDDGGLSHDDGSHVADWALRRYRLRHTGGSWCRTNSKPSTTTHTYSSSIRENGSIPWLFLSFVLGTLFVIHIILRYSQIVCLLYSAESTARVLLTSKSLSFDDTSMSWTEDWLPDMVPSYTFTEYNVKFVFTY